MREHPSARIGTRGRGRRGSHRRCGRVCLEPHGFELAKVHTRSLEDSQTHVRLFIVHPFWYAGLTTRRRGRLKIAEVSSRFENVDQFVSLISSVGFKFKSKVIFNAYPTDPPLIEPVLFRTTAILISRLSNSRKLPGGVRRSGIGRNSCRKRKSLSLANTNAVDVRPFW